MRSDPSLQLQLEGFRVKIFRESYLLRLSGIAGSCCEGPYSRVYSILESILGVSLLVEHLNTWLYRIRVPGSCSAC